MSCNTSNTRFTLKSRTDASNVYDEEVMNGDDMYYSDDEKERQAKNRRKPKNRQQQQQQNFNTRSLQQATYVLA